MKYCIPFLVFLFGTFSQAELKSAKALSTTIRPGKFTGSLTAGHHFNEKAPNQVLVDGRTAKPARLAAREIDFDLPASFASGEASLYVCDDAVTYCETHLVKIAGKGAVKATPAATASKSPRSARIGTDGFIHDDLASALSQAKKKKQLVIADFSAAWCPGCVRYETEIFPTAEFRKLTKDFVKVRIDVDQFENFDTSKRYDIQGIPALVALNGDGEEIGRLIDFQPVDKLGNFLSELRRDPTPMNELRKKAADPSARLLLARRLLAAGQAADSLPWFEKIEPAPSELLAARVQAAEAAFRGDEKKKEDYAAALRNAIRAESGSTRSLGWRAELLGVIDGKSAEAKTVLQDGMKLADGLLKNPQELAEAVKTDSLGEFTGQEKFLTAIARAELIAASGAAPETAKAAWELAADVGASEKTAERGSGPALRYLLILNAAEKWEAAEQLADRMLKKEPRHFDLRRRKIKILLALKKYPEAVTLGESLITEAKGRNQFWVAEGLAKAYVGAQKPAAAKELLQRYLAREELTAKEMRSSKQSMETLLKTLQ